MLCIPHEPTKGYMQKKSEPVVTQHRVYIFHGDRGDLSRTFYSTNLGITISGASQKGDVPWGCSKALANPKLRMQLMEAAGLGAGA